MHRGLQDEDDLTHCRWHECRGCDAAAGLDASGSHLQWLRRFKGSASSMQALRRIAAVDGLGPAAIGDDEVITQVAHGFDTGWLRRCGRLGAASARAHDGGAAPVRAQAPAPPPRAAPRVKERHWIEIEMVGADGVGLAGLQYVIETADKDRHTGVTDRNGLARLDDVVVGTCKISFPGLDRDTWRPL